MPASEFRVKRISELLRTNISELIYYLIHIYYVVNGNTVYNEITSVENNTANNIYKKCATHLQVIIRMLSKISFTFNRI